MLEMINEFIRLYELIHILSDVNIAHNVLMEF